MVENADDANRSKWNARYAYSQQQAQSQPAALTAFAEPHLPLSGVALDLACGRGANALWLAEHGFDVHAWDHSETVIDEASKLARRESITGSLQVAVRDVIAVPPAPNTFDVLLVCRFLDRGLCASLIDALKPGGMLLYQTFTQGLANSDYVLKPNELLHLFAPLRVISYIEPVTQKDKSEAMLVAKKPLPCLESNDG